MTNPMEELEQSMSESAEVLRLQEENRKLRETITTGQTLLARAATRNFEYRGICNELRKCLLYPFLPKRIRLAVERTNRAM